MLSSFYNAPFHQKLMLLGGFFSATLIFATPFSTSACIIISAILFLLWLISGQFKTLPALLKSNPIAMFGILLFALFFIGTVYGNTPIKQALSVWLKYRELLLLVIMLAFITEPKFQKWAFTAFIFASIGTLLISYGMYFDFIPRPLYAATLKSIITHSIMVSFFAFFCAQQIILKTSKKMQWVWGLLLLLTTHNLFFVAMGRTGQLIGLALIILFCFQHLSKRKTLLIISACILFIVLFINFSEIGFRITEGFSNVFNYDPSNPETESSMGKRLTFWQNTLRLIAEKPLLGHGTGSFTVEFKRVIANDAISTGNPHNEFLYITSQLGIPGLLLLLGFIASQFQYQSNLPDQYRWLAQGLLVTFIITCLFNTPILDHTEGHWFISLLALFYAPLSNVRASQLC
jgi:O-antigen ligase